MLRPIITSEQALERVRQRNPSARPASELWQPLEAEPNPPKPKKPRKKP